MALRILGYGAILAVAAAKAVDVVAGAGGVVPAVPRSLLVAADQQVAAGAALDHVVATAAVQPVVAVGALQAVGARLAIGGAAGGERGGAEEDGGGCGEAAARDLGHGWISLTERGLSFGRRGRPCICERSQ